MKIKTLALAVAMAATGTAHAAINPGTNDALAMANSELFLTVFDPSAEMSFNFDLGGSAYNMIDTNSFASVNLAADPEYTAFLGQTDLRFTVTAVNRADLVDADSAIHFGLLTTSTNNAAHLTTIMTGSADIQVRQATVSSMAGNINANAVATGQPDSGTALYNINNSSVALVGQIGYYNVATWGDTLGGAGYTSAGSVGSSLDFYHVGLDLDSLFNGVELVTANLMGSWNLGTDGMLTYTAVSAVPVPAAVWLFGSGLLGLVGVARRKNAQK